MPSNLQAYLVDEDTIVGPEWVKRVFGDIDRRIAKVEDQATSVDAAVDELKAFGLQRVDDALRPAFEEVQALANLGVLLQANSASSVAVGTGSKTFVVAEVSRNTFAPASYLIVRSVADAGNAMAGYLTSYDRDTGDLVVDVQVANGSGAHADWLISVGALPNVTHEARTDNPHAVTAAQVGAYTQAEVDAALTTIEADVTAAEAAIVAIEAERVSAAAVQSFTASEKSQARQNIYAAPAFGVFFKAASGSCVFAKTGADTATIAAGTAVEVGGVVVSFASATAIVMPTLTAGTDYAVHVCSDGTVRADASFSAPTGYTTADSRRIGGFHYAPGGNATGTAGGDTTPAINEYSLWDLKWRPACDDPRGMALVAGAFWCDIYLLGVDHHTNGTSKYNVTIADGTSPPKIPTAFGGNGSTAYGNLTWWVSGEVLQSHGKQPLTYDEFAAATYGTTEATSGGTDPVSTILRQAYTSKWGVMLATGNLWVWGSNFGGGSAGAAWVVNTDGRGSTYQLENGALWGGSWGAGADSGSRCSLWVNSPTNADESIGARGRCDHLSPA